MATNPAIHQTPQRRSISRFDASVRANLCPVITDWPDLPVVSQRERITESLTTHQVIVLTGETGSGKTTQLPKICLQAGRGLHGLIGHTQPRRLAARTVAQRIADELQTPLGQAVGFKIRFTDQTNPNTFVKLMTDGILLAETQTDRDLRQYDTLIIDEAHERSLNIDFLLGYLKRLLPRRPDLKIIITSATIDPQRFSRHFDNAPIIEVSGRTYPVETIYRPLSIDERTIDDDAPANDEADLTEIEGVVQAIRELWTHERGDTLVFLPTERDIRDCADALEQANFSADILPLFSRLSSGDQLKVFQPNHKRARIVLATNVAETSVTVPGIRYVIDTGLARLSRYNPRTKVQRLPIEPISQASADQRKGRCGRVAPGVCVRLYSEKDFLSRPAFTDPEILRTNLASVILQMKWLRLGRIEDFPFIDPPDPRQIRDGLATLHEIGAIDEQDNLTPIGRRLAKLPLDPRVARMIVGGQDEKCEHDTAIIAAALSTQDVRDRPTDQQDAADQSHAKFKDDQSDFITLLKLFNALREKQHELSSSQFRKWCRANFISYLRFREWSDVHHQLCDAIGIHASRAMSNNIRRPNSAIRSPQAVTAPQRNGELDPIEADPFLPAHRDAIHRALLPGLLSNIAIKADAGTYTGARGTKLSIWPGSSLFKSRPHCVMGAELIETTRLYARTVAPLKVEWIERAARHLVTRTHTEPHWVKETAHVHAFEKVSLFGLLLVPRRSVHYGPIDPPASRQLFIHHALVLHEFRTDHPAVLANRQAIKEIESWQTKLRRRDILADPLSFYSFFDTRVPAHVFSGPTFDEWTRRGKGSNWRELELTTKQLLHEAWHTPGADARVKLKADTDTNFPDHLTFDGLKLPLEYTHDPGDDHDGITVTVPVTLLPQLSEARLEWAVPGMVKEKIDALIRSLPKRLRTAFVPVNETVEVVRQKLPPHGIGALVDHVAGILWKLNGEVIRRTDFQSDQIAPHLLLNVRVIDSAGATLAEGRDAAALRAKLGQQSRASVSSLADPRYTRDKLQSWDFGDLPARVEIDYHGARVHGYPTLVEQADTVSLRLLDSQDNASALMPIGLRRLFIIEAAKEIKLALRDLPNLEALRLNYRPFGTGDELIEDLTLVLADRAFFEKETGDVRTRDAFADRAGRAWKRLFETSRMLGKLVTEVLERHRTLASQLGRVFPPLLVDSVDDMRQQLSRLLPKRFIRNTPGDKLEHLPRYLKAIETRVTKLQNAGLSKDLSGLMTLRPLQRQLDDTQRAHAQRSIVDPALLEYRWLLEEFRVSVFAQEIKAQVPVSAKRLDQVWAQVKRV